MLPGAASEDRLIAFPSLDSPSINHERPGFDGAPSPVRLVGWTEGFEPSISWATTRCLRPLGYAHRESSRPAQCIMARRARTSGFRRAVSYLSVRLTNVSACSILGHAERASVRSARGSLPATSPARATGPRSLVFSSSSLRAGGGRLSGLRSMGVERKEGRAGREAEVRWMIVRMVGVSQRR